MLGIFAMLAAILSAPATTTYAFAMADQAASAMEMPCHDQPDPCPDCAKSACPDMGSCLLKCFQVVASIPTASLLASPPPAADQTSLHGRSELGSLISPLLRPPSA